LKYEKIQSKVASEESAQPVAKSGVRIPDTLAGLEIDMNDKHEMSFV
jgi:hypothetical protein